MILDILPNQYETIAQQHSLRPWQTGLLADMLEGENRFISVNMGRSAGHTYFTRIAASSCFPNRTKVYLTRQENLSEYSDLLFDENKVHEPIELLDRDDFSGFEQDPHMPVVDFIVIDMSQEHTRRFKSSIKRIVSTIPSETRVVLLQANILNF